MRRFATSQALLSHFVNRMLRDTMSQMVLDHGFATRRRNSNARSPNVFGRRSDIRRAWRLVPWILVRQRLETLRVDRRCLGWDGITIDDCRPLLSAAGVGIRRGYHQSCGGTLFVSNDYFYQPEAYIPQWRIPLQRAIRDRVLILSLHPSSTSRQTRGTSGHAA